LAVSSKNSRWTVPGRNDERWKSLCEQASQEKDPNRLMELVQEINTILGGEAPEGGAEKLPSTTAKDAA
jgi:hypothetical protein